MVVATTTTTTTAATTTTTTTRPPYLALYILFPSFEGLLKSYIDELLGGPSLGPLAHFGPLSYRKYQQKPTKTERLAAALQDKSVF